MVAGIDDLDGGGGNDRLDDGDGDDRLSADEGDDVLQVGPGADEVFGEPGADTIYLLNDGVTDTVFCGPVEGGDPGDLVFCVERPGPPTTSGTVRSRRSGGMTMPWSAVQADLELSCRLTPSAGWPAPPAPRPRRTARPASRTARAATAGSAT